MTLSIAANRTFAFVPALLSVSVFVLSAVCPDAAWARPAGRSPGPGYAGWAAASTFLRG
mgnify:CR=1 FL=1